MIYITGDTHGNFDRIEHFLNDQHTSRDDIMIILGDAGINYFGDQLDEQLKKYLAGLPITLFCIRGNHEARPEHIAGYEPTPFCGGSAWRQKRYPNLYFAIDGETYLLGGKTCMAIGGAYSVDKPYRLAIGKRWFSDEQLFDYEKVNIDIRLEWHHANKIDVFLTHTCPAKYIPTEMFIPNVDQSTVDQSMEKFLDMVEDTVEYSLWYCGHWHTSKVIDKIRFMFLDIAPFGEGGVSHGLAQV